MKTWGLGETRATLILCIDCLHAKGLHFKINKQAKKPQKTNKQKPQTLAAS